MVVTQNVQRATGTLPATASYLLIAFCSVSTLLQAGCGSDPEVVPTAASDATPASIATVEVSQGETLTSEQESSESVVSPMTPAETPDIVSTETPAVVEPVSGGNVATGNVATGNVATGNVATGNVASRVFIRPRKASTNSRCCNEA